MAKSIDDAGLVWMNAHRRRDRAGELQRRAANHSRGHHGPRAHHEKVALAEENSTRELTIPAGTTVAAVEAKLKREAKKKKGLSEIPLKFRSDRGPVQGRRTQE